jgi:nucleotide-binding universal stress UspA family protein
MSSQRVSVQQMSGQQDGEGSRIVAGVDGSPSSMDALQWAIGQAGLTGASVDAVIAWHYPAAVGGFGYAPVDMMQTGSDFHEIAQKIVTDAISNAADRTGDVRVHPRVIEGNPAQVLLSAAVGADLLVVGSRGHGGFTEALLGSVSQHCVHLAPCPVVVIRGQAQG